MYSTEYCIVLATRCSVDIVLKICAPFSGANPGCWIGEERKLLVHVCPVLSLPFSQWLGLKGESRGGEMYAQVGSPCFRSQPFASELAPIIVKFYFHFPF